jgi:hypothetical protein
MSFALPFRLPSSRNARMICAAVGLMAAALAISSFQRKPRAWPAGDVPIAFWAWRNQAPTAGDVREAIYQAHARTIFLRAGQIDYQDGKLRRIRPVAGSLPTGIDLHLVYNATRLLLSQLENVDENALADSIASAFTFRLARFVVNLRHETTTTLPITADFTSRSFLFLIRNSNRCAALNTAGATSAFCFTAARAAHALNP